MATTIESGGTFNQESFIALYDKYAPAIMGVISRIVGNARLAEDVLQSAFVEMWNSIKKYDASKEKIFIWMLKIARKFAIESSGMKRLEPGTATVNVATGTDVKSAGNISEGQPGILNLVFLDGCSLSEAARLLNEEEEKVRKSVISAVKNLKQMKVA